MQSNSSSLQVLQSPHPPLSNPRPHGNNSKRPTQIAVNDNKFKLLETVILCPHIASWKTALASVDISSNRVLRHDFASLFRGYALPDPWLFAMTYAHDKQRASRFLLVWAIIHDPWLAKLQQASSSASPTSSSSAFPSPQHWKLYLQKVGGLLNIPIEQPPASSSKQMSSQHHPPAKVKASKRARLDKFKDDVDSLFDLNISASDFRFTDISWFGFNIKGKGDNATTFNVSLKHGMLMLWEMTEVNFRLELLALDRCVVSRAGMSEAAAGDRDDAVRKVFEGSVVFLLEFSDNPQGLNIGSDDWRIRLGYVEYFRVLLLDWDEPLKSKLSDKVLDMTTSTEGDVLAVEAIIFPFYCQTFFDYFGRAPTIPRPLNLPV